MSFSFRDSRGQRKNALLLLAAVALPATLAIATAGMAAPLPSYDPALASAATGFDRATLEANLALSPTADTAASSAAIDPRELECMAKVVRHEAGNQSRAGQLAVAQLLVNRTKSGRFADTICGVAAQPRQFFDVASYAPRQDAGWDMAVAVSREALTGQGEDVAPGALFFHAGYARRSAFFQTRQRVATLGGNVFYR